MRNNLPRTLFIAAHLMLLLAIGAGVTYILVVASSDNALPSLEELENPKPDLASTVLSADGEVLDQFFTQRRGWVPYDSIPKDFINALIATEDRVFFDHWGIHISRIFKASIKNVFFGRREGGSTITQQLARNLYDKIGFASTLERKILEAVTAVEIEKRYTKQEILEMYTNTVNFGRGAYGIETAARLFFDKDPLYLSISECAYLVALLKSPSNYDAQRRYERAIERRNLVLYNMRNMDYIGEAQYRQSASEPILFSDPKPYVSGGGIAPHFVELVRRTLSKDTSMIGNYNIYKDGLVIYTTLNARMQVHANNAVKAHFAELQADFNNKWSWKNKRELLNSFIQRAIKAHPLYLKAPEEERSAVAKKLQSSAEFRDSVLRDAIAAQTGLVVVEHQTGEVRALVGSSRIGKEAKYTLNRAVQIRRQPGSSFKPFVYASALRKGLSPTSVMNTTAFSYSLPEGGIWSLRKNGVNIPDALSLSSALKYSINTVAARLITEYTTPREVAELAQAMGIRSKLPVFPSLALGACEVSPWEMTAAYGTFANQGIALEPIFITRIEDRYGNVIYEQKPGRNAENALEPSLANAMTTMMKQVVQSGTATRIKQFYYYDAAGKTGTTNDFTDAWFAGYTPSLTSAIWIGFDDIRIKFTGDYGQGGRAVAPLWGRMMGAIYADTLLPYRRTPRFKEENPASDSTLLEENLGIIPSEVENPDTDSVISEPPDIPPQPVATNRTTRLPSLRRNTDGR